MFTLPDELQLPARSEAGEMDPILLSLDALVGQAENIMVDGADGLAQAEVFLRQIDSAITLIDGLAERFRKPAFDYYKEVLAEKSRQLDGPEQAKDVLRNKIREYMVENDIQTDGFHIRVTWKAELVDLEQLVHMVANGDAPLELLQLNTKFANKAASTLQKGMSYSGLKAKPTTTLAKTNAKSNGS